MKVSQPPVRGSMGIPPEMTEAFERQREAAKRRAAQPDPVMEDDPSPARVDAPEDEAEEKKSSSQDPEGLLQEIGVALDDDDLHRFIFKGYVEKDVKISFFGGKKSITVMLKTLTAGEYDAISELLGEEIEKSTIMRDDVVVRRNMWTLSLGVSKIDGRPLVAKIPTIEVTVDGRSVQRTDYKALARSQREVLGSLAAPVVSELIVAHGKLCLALQLMTQEKGTAVLKK